MNKETVKAALVFMLAGLACGIIIGLYLGRGHGDTVRVERDTVTIVKTIADYSPTANDSVQVRYITKFLPIVRHDTISNYTRDTIIREVYSQDSRENIPPLYASVDSAAVVIPITQKRYESEDYRAYVSGYEPNLDSIFVFPKTTTIRERRSKPPDKWHIGLHGGIGYGFKSRQAEPFIGIGISYSIISF
jgi:hypothetical protein